MKTENCTGQTVAAPPQPVNDRQRRWLTPDQAAEYLQVERRTILTWVHLGKLKGYQLSGTERHVWRFLHSDLDAMLCAPSVASEWIIQ